VKISITKSILLSIALVFTPLLNYSMAHSLSQINHSARTQFQMPAASSHYHSNTATGNNNIYCSAVTDSSGNHSAGSCHQKGEQCNISCCGSLTFISAAASLPDNLLLPPVYYHHLPPLAASINIDIHLPPPRSV